MDTADLIFEIIEEKGMDHKEFARLIEVSEKIVSTWSTKRTKSYTKHLDKIAAVLGTTTDYLHTGIEKRGDVSELVINERLNDALLNTTEAEQIKAAEFLEFLKSIRETPLSPDK